MWYTRRRESAHLATVRGRKAVADRVELLLNLGQRGVTVEVRLGRLHDQLAEVTRRLLRGALGGVVGLADAELRADSLRVLLANDKLVDLVEVRRDEHVALARVSRTQSKGEETWPL